ncbi:MAG: cobalamin biosynthesis protein CbiG, partial [Synergistaceae bacterium]|nr:cobalamin biosynthesis protein CbiG [Synergistaceae bacterium]
MNTAIAAFTERGVDLALRIAGFLGGDVFAPERISRDGVRAIDGSLTEWAGKIFRRAGTIVF